MLILNFAKSEDIEPFKCSSCTVRRNGNETKAYTATMKARRCDESRWNFTEKDNRNVFPVLLGGVSFGFCPGKLLRGDDPRALDLFRKLIAIFETSTWPVSGGLNEQDHDLVELFFTFNRSYREIKESRFVEKLAKSMFGDGKNNVSRVDGHRYQS